MSTDTLRVRHILSNLDPNKRAELKKLLPPKLVMPANETARYPSALLTSLPQDEVGQYAYLGLIAEEVLRLPSTEINLENLIAAVHGRVPEFSAVAEAKVRKSTTTQPFLDCLVATRKELEKVLRTTDAEGPLRFEEEVVFGSVAGHPDMWNNTQVFEVKFTGMLKQNWISFLFQTFAYGALMSTAKDIYIVMPLQKCVWHYNLAGWKDREKYKTFLTTWSSSAQTTGVANQMAAMLLCATHSIGSHVGKLKTLTDTIAAVANPSTPYQIFLSGPQNSNIKAVDSDLASALDLVTKSKSRIFVHSQYLINLSNKETADAWHEKLLIKNLEITRAFGGKGVVVHVGKACKLPTAEAIEQMRAVLGRCLQHATAECPLLLETPAGQGTELLTDKDEFITFVESFADPRLRVCMDSCHVFAAGHNPVEYLQALLEKPNLLKLVHYNDSLEPCGSCKDRHAHVGSGHIGFPTMTEIAEICSAYDIPMVIE